MDCAPTPLPQNTRERAGSRVELLCRVALYGHANFWMRALPESATKTSPLLFTATPVGESNSPSPLPELPHSVRNVPVFVNVWMWLELSATKTFPLPFTAMPVAETGGK